MLGQNSLGYFRFGQETQVMSCYFRLLS